MNKNNDNDFPVSLLAFTFFYAVTIYVFLLGYHYWTRNRELEQNDD